MKHLCMREYVHQVGKIINLYKRFFLIGLHNFPIKIIDSGHAGVSEFIVI